MSEGHRPDFLLKPMTTTSTPLQGEERDDMPDVIGAGRGCNLCRQKDAALEQARREGEELKVWFANAQSYGKDRYAEVTRLEAELARTKRMLEAEGREHTEAQEQVISLQAELARLREERDHQLRLKEQALDEVNRLRNIRSTWDEGHAAGYRSAEHNFMHRIEQAEALAATFRAALERYGQHAPDCEKHGGFDSQFDVVLRDKRSCTCGFDQALALSGGDIVNSDSKGTSR